MSVKFTWPIEQHEAPRRVIPFYGFFLAAGIALLIPLLLLPVYRSCMARSWREVPCIILSSGVQSKGEIQGGTTFQVAVTYSYVVNGREYTGNRHDFFPVATIGYRSKAEVARQYAAGSHRQCLVDPDDPAQSVLTRYLGARLWIGLFPLALIAASVFGIIHTVRQARSRSTAPAQ